MKKILTITMAFLLVLSMAACGGNQSDQTTTAPVKDTAPAGNQTTTAPVETTPVQQEAFSFVYEGVTIICGTAFDPTGLPEVEPSRVPSCAFDREDVVYTYDSFEVITNDRNGSLIVYSIYFLDPNLTTPEGLAMGDDAAKITTLYGTDCQNANGEIVYQKGDTRLVIVLQNDTVFSIEYRLAM